MMEYCNNFDFHMFALYFKFCNYDSYNMSCDPTEIMYISLVPLVSLSYSQVPPIPMWDLIESSGPKICVVVVWDYTSF